MTGDLLATLASLADAGSQSARDALERLTAQALAEATGHPSAQAPAVGGRCQWLADGADVPCGAPTRAKTKGPQAGQPRKYCAEHGKLARERWRATIAASGSAERKVVNAAALAAVTAKLPKRPTGKAVRVTISPPTCSFALYVLSNVPGATRDGGEVTIEVPPAAAKVWHDVLAGFDWTDATTTVPKVRVEA